MPELLSVALKKSDEFGPILDHIGITIERGETYFLVGKPKSGKTTLIELICSLIPNEIKSRPTLDRRQISYMPKGLLYYSYMTVDDLIEFYRINPDFDRNICIKYLCDFDIKISKLVRKLPINQLQTLGFVLALSRRVDFYVLDEPFENINTLLTGSYKELYSVRKNRKTSFLFATNQIDNLENVEGKILVIKSTKELCILDPVEVKASGKTVKEAIESVFVPPMTKEERAIEKARLADRKHARQTYRDELDSVDEQVIDKIKKEDRKKKKLKEREKAIVEKKEPVPVVVPEEKKPTPSDGIPDDIRSVLVNKEPVNTGFSNEEKQFLFSKVLDKKDASTVSATTPLEPSEKKVDSGETKVEDKVRPVTPKAEPKTSSKVMEKKTTVSHLADTKKAETKTSTTKQSNSGSKKEAQGSSKTAEKTAKPISPSAQKTSAGGSKATTSTTTAKNTTAVTNKKTTSVGTKTTSQKKEEPVKLTKKNGNITLTEENNSVDKAKTSASKPKANSTKSEVTTKKTEKSSSKKK